MKNPQTYRAALIAAHTIDSPPQKTKSALRGLMQRVGLASLACAFVIGATGSASAGETQDEIAVRALPAGCAVGNIQAGYSVWVRLIRKLAEFIDGSDLSERNIGDVGEMPEREARTLIAEG